MPRVPLVSIGAMVLANINRCCFTGTVLSVGGAVFKGRGGVRFLLFTLNVINRSYDAAAGQHYDEYMCVPCIAFNDDADALHKLLHTGEKVAVEATMHMNVRRAASGGRNADSYLEPIFYVDSYDLGELPSWSGVVADSWHDGLIR